VQIRTINAEEVRSFSSASTLLPIEIFNSHIIPFYIQAVGENGRAEEQELIRNIEQLYNDNGWGSRFKLDDTSRSLSLCT
jgi:hypothetical protein